jgi:membrane glycosyltransferase
MGNISELLRNFLKSIKLLQGSRILHYMSIDRWWILLSASLILFRMDNQITPEWGLSNRIQYPLWIWTQVALQTCTSFIIYQT